MRPGGYCFQCFTMTRAPLAQCDLIARACGDCGLRYMASLCVPKTCLYRKLDSAIMVMKSAEDGRRYNVAHVPDGAMDRSVLVERPMSPQLIIVGGITMFRPSGGTFHSGLGCNVRPKRHAVTASGRLPAMIRCANSLSSASPACASAAHSATKSTTSPAPTACRGRHEPPALGRAPRRKNIWAL